MKLKKICSLLLLSAFSLPVVSVQAASHPNHSAKDGEALGFLVVLDKNEMNAAKLISKKNVDSQVKNYARMMYQDHNKNFHQTTNLSHKIKEKPAETEMVLDLKQKGKDELIVLKPLKDKELEVTYIDTMVKGHHEALVKIDRVLLKEVENPALKKHLQITRASIVKHFKKAQEIQHNLKEKSAN